MAEFRSSGTYLNAAAIHPTPRSSVEAAQAMLAYQQDRVAAHRPPLDVRQGLATLINADADEIALVPSTGIAENLVASALRLGPGRGVVTDALHFEGALAMYGERARRGMPLRVVQPRAGRIAIDDIAAAIRPDTRLIALAEVSNYNGFRHDLKAVCDLAHAHGVRVFADVIQSVGAVPIDVRSSGVDMLAASTYKWLMGDLGFGFLYVKRDLLAELERPVVGWAQLDSIAITGQRSPGDPPIADSVWRFSDSAAGMFEAGQPSNVAAATVQSSLGLLRMIGVNRGETLRNGLRAEARDRIGRLPGVTLLTPDGMSTPIETFGIRDARARFAGLLKAAGIEVGLYDNRLRISPSFYNDAGHIERLAEVIRRG